MASGFTVGGVDLDSIFAPRAGHTPAANTGFRVGTQDLADRYRASDGGSDRIGYNTGFLAGEIDLRWIFRDINYVETPPPEIHSVSNNGPVYVGQTITLTVSASGWDTITWRRVSTGAFVGSGASCSFTATSTTGNTYSCEVTNGWGSVFDSTTVTVNAVPAPTVSISGPSSVAAGSFNGETWSLSASNPVALTQVIFYVADHTLMNWTPVSGTSYTGAVTWSDGFGVPSISHTPGTYTFYFAATASGGITAFDSMTVTVT